MLESLSNATSQPMSFTSTGSSRTGVQLFGKGACQYSLLRNSLLIHVVSLFSAMSRREETPATESTFMTA